MQHLKKHKKEKTTLFVNTTVLTALVKMSIFLHFSFLLFWEFPFFQRCFLIGFQKSKKNNKIPKQQKQKTTTIENKTQWKKKGNIMIQNKTRQQAKNKTK